MPNIKFKEDRARESRERAYADLGAKIAYYMKLYSITPEELAIICHFSRGTIYTRINDPSSWRLGELLLLTARFGVPIDDLLAPGEPSRILPVARDRMLRA